MTKHPPSCSQLAPIFYIAAYANAMAAPPTSNGAWVIIGAAALLELELDELELLPAPVTPVPPGEDDVVFVVLSVDDSDVEESVSVRVAAEFVGRGPAVNVTSWPAPSPEPPSVKLVVVTDIVVREPEMSAVPNPEQTPVKLEYEQPMPMVLIEVSLWL